VQSVSLYDELEVNLHAITGGSIPERTVLLVYLLF